MFRSKEKLLRCAECGRFAGNSDFCSPECAVAYSDEMERLSKEDRRRYWFRAAFTRAILILILLVGVLIVYVGGLYILGAAPSLSPWKKIIAGVTAGVFFAYEFCFIVLRKMSRYRRTG